MAPPLKISRALVDTIVAHVKRGLYPAKAATAAGISRAQYFVWQQRAERGEQPFADYFDEIESAKSQMQGDILDAIKAAGSDPKHWTALAWILERTDPEHYAIRSIVNLKVDKELELILDALKDGLPPDIYARCLEIIAARAEVSGATASSAAPTEH